MSNIIEMKSEKTVNVTVETLSAKLKIDRVRIESVVSFCNGGLTLSAFEVVSGWHLAGEIFGMIKENYGKKEFAGVCDSVFGKKVNKNQRAYSIKLSEIEFETLKSWYVTTGQTVTDPYKVYSLFNSQDEEKEASGKTDLQKIEELISNLQKKLEKVSLSTIEAAAIGSKLLALSNIDLTVEMAVKKSA